MLLKEEDRNSRRMRRQRQNFVFVPKPRNWKDQNATTEPDTEEEIKVKIKKEGLDFELLTKQMEVLESQIHLISNFTTLESEGEGNNG